MKAWGGLTAFGLLVILAGCLSDSDSVAGIEGTGSPTTVSGSVTAYGSVYVNGVHIDIDTAELLIDGEPVDTDDIELGMVVDIELDSLEGDSAVADRVRSSPALRAPIDSVEETSDVRRELRVLEQTLVVHDDARFDGVSLDGLEAGTWIEVSGFADAEGRWTASRVADAEGGALAVRGRATAVDRDARELRLNQQRVSYAEADVNVDELEEDRWLRASGGEVRDSVYYPTRIDVESTPEREDGAQLLQEGVIGRYVSNAAFDVSGVTVDASGVDGVGDELEQGVRVAVRGELDDGVLIAESAQTLEPGINRIRARVDEVDPDSGTLTLLGTEYESSSLTAYEDQPGQGRGPMNLDQIRAGDRVEVHARYRDERAVASRIKRLDDNDESAELRGPVTGLDPDNDELRVMGVTVSVSQADGGELLSQLRYGQQVRVKGELNGTLIASELGLVDVPPGLASCPPPLAENCEPPGTPLPTDDTTSSGESLRF